jgi:hypothetical protein
LVIFAYLDPDPVDNITANSCGSGSSTLIFLMVAYTPPRRKTGKRKEWREERKIPVGEENMKIKKRKGKRMGGGGLWSDIPETD